MLTELPTEIREEILSKCQGRDVLNVSLTSSQMYTDFVKKLLWRTIKIDLDHVRTRHSELPMLKYVECLTLCKKKKEEEARNALWSGRRKKQEEEKDDKLYLSGQYFDRYDDPHDPHYRGRSFIYQEAVWQWYGYVEEDFEDWGVPPNLEELEEDFFRRLNDNNGNFQGGSFIFPPRKKIPNPNLFFSQLELPMLTELRITDIHSIVDKNPDSFGYTEHSGNVVENLLRDLRYFENLRVVHIESLQKRSDWETDWDLLANQLSNIDERIYLMSPDEFRHIEEIPNLEELKFINIWIGKPFQIPSLKKLSVNFYTNFRMKLGRMERLEHFEGTNVTLLAGKNILFL